MAPITPPIPAIRIDSARINATTRGLLNPMAFRTATSVVRSRRAMAIALAVTQSKEIPTASPMKMMIHLKSPIISANI